MKSNTYRVLAIDGGGIRGAYSAGFIDHFERHINGPQLRTSISPNLVGGTSTGGIIACAIAHGVAPSRIVDFYRESGPAIFARNSGVKPEPRRRRFRRLMTARHDSAPLRRALVEVFGDEKLSTVYERSGIALVIPVADLGKIGPTVFKTPHDRVWLGQDDHALSDGVAWSRDGELSIVDVCMATTAAPTFFEPHAITMDGVERRYADGGLVANSPVLVALLEALDLAEPDQDIHVISIGTCPVKESYAAPEGKGGFIAWGKFAAPYAIDCSAELQLQMAIRTARQLSLNGRKIHVDRLHASALPNNIAQKIEMDRAEPSLVDALIAHGHSDAEKLLSKLNAGRCDQRVRRFFENRQQ